MNIFWIGVINILHFCFVISFHQIKKPDNIHKWMLWIPWNVTKYVGIIKKKMLTV